MSKEITLYLPGSPSEPIQTINGEMPYLDWLHKEANRINRRPGRACRVIQENGECWAVVNQNAGCVVAPK